MQSTEIIQITMNFHVNISCGHEIKIIEDCWMCHISQIVYYSLEMDPKRKKDMKVKLTSGRLVHHSLKDGIKQMKGEIQ